MISLDPKYPISKSGTEVVHERRGSPKPLIQFIAFIFRFPFTRASEKNKPEESPPKLAESDEVHRVSAGQFIPEIRVRVINHETAREIVDEPRAVKKGSVKFLAIFDIYDLPSPATPVVFELAESEHIRVHIDVVLLPQDAIGHSHQATSWRLAESMADIESFLTKPNRFENTLLIIELGNTALWKICAIKRAVAVRATGGEVLRAVATQAGLNWAFT
ncbi:hypothetical protein TWF481_000660 [Arthrobotrys musiformis]|uniref:Uncharacterized protein n=1 Tax=Arthrobotrys musiformis TaxID=47236 RepID=A0AAV9WN89_9PEZI